MGEKQAAVTPVAVTFRKVRRFIKDSFILKSILPFSRFRSMRHAHNRGFLELILFQKNSY